MTLREAKALIKARLLPVSGEDAAFEAKQLIAYALEKKTPLADGDAELMPAQLERLFAAAERRLSHEPLQYILGEWEFCGLPFKVTRDALIPRQDTETLVEEAERLIAERGYKTLLDICTGTGCIGIALQKRTGIKAALSDINENALELAAKNARANGVECEIKKSDLFEAFSGRSFDLITANPPYIPSETVKTLSEEVRHEPALALDGGADGLGFYRRIAKDFQKYLNEGGSLIMEIGFDQGASVPALFSNVAVVELIKDLAGNDRVATVCPRDRKKEICLQD